MVLLVIVNLLDVRGGKGREGETGVGGVAESGVADGQSKDASE